LSKSLIILSHRPDDLAFAAQVALAAGLTMKHPPDHATAMRLIGEEEGPVIFVDASTQRDYLKFESAVQDVFGLFSAKITANRLHYLSSGDISEVPYLIGSPIFGSYVRRNYASPGVGEHYGLLIRASLEERAFGIQRLIKSGTRVQTIQLKSSLQKQDAVEVVRNYLVALKFQTRMATVIANAVDELIMNAIYDAPVDSAGKCLYGVTARNSQIELTGRSAVELQVAHDGEYVTLTALDLFGSLDKAKLLSAISKVYRQQDYKVRTGAAGAGLGLATVFRSGGSFHFASENGVRTEVSVFFRKTENFREFKNQFRFISTQFYF
jgi:anti-sigma regulatory factor (Ser/Thr protein kinase)